MIHAAASLSLDAPMGGPSDPSLDSTLVLYVTLPSWLALHHPCTGKEEVLLVEAAQPPSQAQRQPAAVYMVMAGPGEGTPMYAYPVSCPDGRVVYQLTPAAQRAVRLLRAVEAHHSSDGRLAIQDLCARLRARRLVLVRGPLAALLRRAKSGNRFSGPGRRAHASLGTQPHACCIGAMENALQCTAGATPSMHIHSPCPLSAKPRRCPCGQQ